MKTTVTFYEAYTLNEDFQMKVGQDFFAFGHSIGWMITDLAGIRYTTEEPNGKRMILAPQVPRSGKLGQVTASLETPMGLVKSAGTYKDDVFTWSSSIPANTSAEVRIPADAADAVEGAVNMKHDRTEAGVLMYEAPAGTYTLRSRISTH